MELGRLTHDRCNAKFTVRLGYTLRKCPVCGVCFDVRYRLSDSSIKCEALPCPFRKQNSITCAIVIKPTYRTFLEYKMGDDLHIGISDSHSTVHSFWLNGISSENTGWDGSIVLCQFNHDKRFEQILMYFIYAYSRRFRGQSYDDMMWNCFDFVIEFMRFMDFVYLTKANFVSEFVEKELRTAIHSRKALPLICGSDWNVVPGFLRHIRTYSSCRWMIGA
ncbi:unnamed protein product [Cylicocyclus nassatus]|uniref:MKRN2 opposite strand protein-like C-terminal domain-containing protein n=1 Tax=Cylicocyclus nassatus TaxID=53992 RepID=A0AA36MCZ5_CYLNA|nr:unnamed protein product [Cylicocyclus nassatus]